MRILVAGATGAIGRNLLPRLVAAGHQVLGTTRTEAKAPLIRQLGCEALIADGLDAGAIQRAVQSARPDVIVHEMTDLKGASDLRHSTAPLRSANGCAPRGRITCSPQLGPPAWQIGSRCVGAGGRRRGLRVAELRGSVRPARPIIADQVRRTSMTRSRHAGKPRLKRGLLSDPRAGVSTNVPTVRASVSSRRRRRSGATMTLDIQSLTSLSDDA